MTLTILEDKSILQLKAMFPEANFMEAKFDHSVMGINQKTNAVIYHEFDMIRILMMEMNEDAGDLDPETDEWCDLYDQCQEMVYMIEEENDLYEAASPKVCRNHEMLYSYTFNRPISES